MVLWKVRYIIFKVHEWWHDWQLRNELHVPGRENKGGEDKEKVWTKDRLLGKANKVTPRKERS